MKVRPASDFLLATNQQVLDFSQIFLDSYNSWEELNPAVCDPLLRVLVNVTFTARGFTANRRLQHDDDNPPQQRDLQRRPGRRRGPRPSIVNFENDDVDFLLSFSGTCDGCETGDQLFNDVSNRRLRNLRTLQSACTGSELRAPTEEEILDLFQSNIQNLTYVSEVSDLREVTNETCPSDDNRFSATADETTFTLTGVKRFSPTNAASFGNALNVLTDRRAMIAFHEEFMQGFCDPQYRTITRAGFGTADLETSSDGTTTTVVLTFTVLDGTCRGCTDLFDDVSLVRRQRRLRRLGGDDVGSSLVSSHTQQAISQRSLQSGGERCWCSTQATQRAPTKEEFEVFLAAKFNELVTTAAVFASP
ncbi:MAG: hypothetical protein SGILL_008913 [Bacillariaceae sp.]